ncbi:MAG: class I SAM-dependent methyltransferase [Nannocystaceae bacterium]|nr:class I SAM-dependent methyltransferase [bacterium]
MGTSTDRAVFDQIDRIRAHREVFASASRRLVGDVLESVAPRGPLIEIGAGDGQLHAWLPASAQARLLCTEPRGLGLSRLQAAGIRAERGRADALPVRSGEASAVLGLCVLDVVERPAQVVAELHRALRPDGYVVHWLDMTTELAPAIAQLHADGLVVLPNVFSDPCAATWPEDLFLVPRAQLERVVEVLCGAGHPAGAQLRRYAARFGRPFSASKATAAFNRLNDDPHARPMLRGAFADALRLGSPAAQAQLRAFQGRPVSSARFFAARLQRMFAGRFAVVHNEIIAVGEVRPCSENAVRYRSLVAGSSRSLEAPPSPRLDASAPHPGPGEQLVELGMHTFIARRVP